MRRAETLLGLAVSLCLLGCGSLIPGFDRVELLTGLNACYAGAQQPSYAGRLVPDPKYGTRIEGQGPVMWMEGYTGRRLPGGDVEVLDTEGNVVATTGREYAIAPAPNYGVNLPPRAILAPDCYPWDFVDCTPGTTDESAAMYCPKR